MDLTQIISTAFIMGSVGSLHCIGMCGPLAMAIPMAHRSNSGRLLGGIIYNSGRIFTYALLGLLLGLAGELIFSARAQSIFSISLGAAILVFILIPSRFKHASPFLNAANKPMMKLRSALSKLLYIKNHRSAFGIGMLNGLLPCGMIYLAITTSFLAGNAFKGSLFMAVFGLGTFPAMLAVIYFGNLMNQQLRLRLRKIVPVFLFCMATLLVLRGLNLGIPYISPGLPSSPNELAVPCH